VAAVLFGVLLGAGAIALVGTLRESPEGYARVGAPATPPEPPATPPEPPATPPEPPATPPAVAQADIVEAPVVPEAKSEPKPNESSAELAPAVAADAGVMVKDRAAPRAPKRAKPAPAASSYRPRDL
jgi:hypothetical protein